LISRDRGVYAMNSPRLHRFAKVLLKNVLISKRNEEYLLTVFKTVIGI